MIIFVDFKKLTIGPKYKKMRHGSLHINVVYKYVRLNVCEMDNNGDILVLKIKVKKSIFNFLTPSFKTYLPIVI